MSSQTLYRLSGISLFAGSLLAAVGFLLHPAGSDPAQYTSAVWLPVNLLILVGAMLVVLGLPGMYARQASRAGKLGVIGLVCAEGAVLMFNVALTAIEAFIYPVLAQDAATRALLDKPPTALGPFILIALLLQLVGPLLLGIATLRARVFPRWAGILLIAALPVVIANGFLHPPAPFASIDAVILYVALASLGFALLAGKTAQPEQATAQIPSTALQR